MFYNICKLKNYCLIAHVPYLIRKTEIVSNINLKIIKMEKSKTEERKVLIVGLYTVLRLDGEEDDPCNHTVMFFNCSVPQAKMKVDENPDWFYTEQLEGDIIENNHLHQA